MIEQTKYEYKKMNKMVAKSYGFKYQYAFEDIATCPVCTQEKPVDAWSRREIKHMRNHIRSPVNEHVINIHCIHFIHNHAFCCRCETWNPKRIVIEGLQLKTWDDKHDEENW